jgi:hypothetical protein
MKWGALVVTGWLVFSAIVAANGRQPTPHAAHDAEETGAAVATTPAAAMNGDEGCWQDYVDRAIEIYLNLIECVKENEWYDTFGYLICELSYEFGAFMAFMRLIACMNA